MQIERRHAMQIERLAEGIRRREIPALARAISLVENGRDGFEGLLSALHEDIGRAHRIGVTGPPGAGKSTLVECLIRSYRKAGKTVGVIAVDPTSPFSGGALLGDRIRMESATADPSVFVRSMATRGAGGGLSTTAREVCDLLDAFGFERILIETVGVGQSELAIAATADTAVLVLVPESGDGVQALKAGIMEIADIYVVNKADRPGAERVKKEIEVMLGIRRGQAYRHIAPHHRPELTPPGGRETEAASGADDRWEPPVILTSAVKGEGTESLVDALEKHREYLERSGELRRRRRERIEQLTREVVDRTLRQLVWGESDAELRLASGLERVLRGERTPYELASEIVAAVRKEIGHGA
jgi:LAO/AO transport system kinase